MSTYNIEGMKCQSCVAKLGVALKNSGYEDAVVTLHPPQVKLAIELSKEELQKIVSQAGDYKVVAIDSVPSAPQAVLPEGSSDEKLGPLFVILAYIVGGVLLRAVLANDWTFVSLMDNFMGAFFVVFSLFKLLNLSGFAQAYATYDIIAARSHVYGLVYPFVELALGIAYFVGDYQVFINSITLVLMTVGSVGVYIALQSKRKFQCACLGTALKLPMTKVTLVEDLTMGLMALVMLVHSWGM